MIRRTVIVLAVLLLLAPGSCMVGMAVVLAPSMRADACTPANGLIVGSLPGHLTATAADGTPVALDRTQLNRAATIIRIGADTPGVGRDGIVVALMAALTESSLRMLANTTAYPESALHPNDGDGGDHDSLGLFQMRPSTGWGTVAQLMDPTYQARAFFGGPTGPNHGSPPGLLDIPDWQTLDPGAAAQAVEVSAFPDRYARYEPVAAAILVALTAPTTTTGTPAAVGETSRVVVPLPNGTWVRTSHFGPRTDPVTGASTVHTGVDYAASQGTPILAVADGHVVFAGAVASGYGHLILIEHTIGGRIVVSGYAHMPGDGIHVRVGDGVTAGQHIADVGSDGKSTGPHLHFEIRPGGPDAAAIDPVPWLTAHRATVLDSTDITTGCLP